MKSFSATIFLVGINPCVDVPGGVLKRLFAEAGKTRGPIRVQGTLNGKAFTQTVVKYRGAWRLYLNTPMRRAAGIDVGDLARVKIGYEPIPPVIAVHQKLQKALTTDRRAGLAFKALPPYRRKEILRYINGLKKEETVSSAINRVIVQLTKPE